MSTQTARWIKKFENDGIEVQEKGKVVRSQADQYGRIVKDVDERDKLAAQFAKAQVKEEVKTVQTIAIMKQVDTSDVGELRKILADKENEKKLVMQKMSVLCAQLDAALELLENKHPS
mmetsp:Transcript_10797/g.22980  ORF Transcript_10797/g.22980 Transcript_10797/m.22980 type:complete len:118 (-) Transcript_10797:1049-1402(-)